MRKGFLFSAVLSCCWLTVQVGAQEPGVLDESSWLREQQSGLPQRIEHLRRAAENLEAAGMLDQARELGRQADQMQREFQSQQGGLRLEGGGGPHDLAQQIAQLRGEVQRLHAELRETHQLVEQLHHRLASQPQPLPARPAQGFRPPQGALPPNAIGRPFQPNRNSPDAGETPPRVRTLPFLNAPLGKQPVQTPGAELGDSVPVREPGFIPEGALEFESPDKPAGEATNSTDPDSNDAELFDQPRDGEEPANSTFPDSNFDSEPAELGELTTGPSEN